MEDFAAVNVFEAEAQLHEPVHDLRLREVLLGLLLLTYVIGHVAVLAELHHDYQDAALKERVLMRHDVRMVQLL